MTQEQFARERDYGAAMAIAKSLLKEGLVTNTEFRKIDTFFIHKYRLVIGGLGVKSLDFTALQSDI